MKPKIPDLDLFKGLVMHTAEWTEGLNLKGKRVGIVGVGSSGTQLLSNICEEEGIDVTVFQRSCTTVLPFDFKVYSEAETADFKEHPEKLTEMREKEWASLESQNETAFIGHPGLDAVTQFAKDYMRSIVKDEQLQKKLEFDVSGCSHRVPFGAATFRSAVRTAPVPREAPGPHHEIL